MLSVPLVWPAWSAIGLVAGPSGKVTLTWNRSPSGSVKSKAIGRKPTRRPFKAGGTTTAVVGLRRLEIAGGVRLAISVGLVEWPLQAMVRAVRVARAAAPAGVNPILIFLIRVAPFLQWGILGSHHRGRRSLAPDRNLTRRLCFDESCASRALREAPVSRHRAPPRALAAPGLPSPPAAAMSYRFLSVP